MFRSRKGGQEVLPHADKIKKLSPEDYALIEHEHARLASYIDKMHDTCIYIKGTHLCSDCGREKQASCSGRLTSFLMDIVNIAEEHFDHEEEIMLSRSVGAANNEYFVAHKKAHNDILLQLESLSKTCNQYDKQDKTVDAYRYLYQQLVGIFSAHDLAFDDPFIQSAKAA